MNAPAGQARVRTLRVRVKPGSRTPGIDVDDDGTWLVRVKAPPVDGKANDEVVSAIARRLGVRRSQVRIRHGAGGRTKRVEVED